MKRIISLVLVMVLVFSSCQRSGVDSSSEAEIKFANKYIELTDDWFHKRTGDTEIGHFEALYTTESLSGSGNSAYLLRITDGRERGKGYLAVEKGDKVFFQPLWRILSYSYIYLCNIDSDADDEVIINQGGAYEYLNLRIYDVTDYGLKEKKNYSFKSNYFYKRCDGYKINIYNKETGFSEILDLEDWRKEEYWASPYNKEGRPHEPEKEYNAASAVAVYPVDENGDKVYELFCISSLCSSEIKESWVAYTKHYFDLKTDEFKFEDRGAEIRILATRVKNDNFENGLADTAKYKYYYPITSYLELNEENIENRTDETGVSPLKIEKQLGEGVYLFTRPDILSDYKQYFLAVEGNGKIYFADIGSLDKIDVRTEDLNGDNIPEVVMQIDIEVQPKRYYRYICIYGVVENFLTLVSVDIYEYYETQTT